MIIKILEAKDAYVIEEIPKGFSARWKDLEEGWYWVRKVDGDYSLSLEKPLGEVYCPRCSLVHLGDCGLFLVAGYIAWHYPKIVGKEFYWQGRNEISLKGFVVYQDKNNLVFVKEGKRQYVLYNEPSNDRAVLMKQVAKAKAIEVLDYDKFESDGDLWICKDRIMTQMGRDAVEESICPSKVEVVPMGEGYAFRFRGNEFDVYLAPGRKE